MGKAICLNRVLQVSVIVKLRDGRIQHIQVRIISEHRGRRQTVTLFQNKIGGDGKDQD